MKKTRTTQSETYSFNGKDHFYFEGQNTDPRFERMVVISDINFTRIITSIPSDMLVKAVKERYNLIEA